MKKKPLSATTLRENVAQLFQQAGHYTIILFVVLLLGVYGFVLYRINVLAGAQPSESDVATQTQSAASLHVDPTVVNQMESLQNNSVNVKTLFDQARTNPFNE